MAKDRLPDGFVGSDAMFKGSGDPGGPKPKGAMWVLQNVLAGFIECADPDAGCQQVLALLDVLQGTISYCYMMLAGRSKLAEGKDE